MAQWNTRVIGGIYRLGPIIQSRGMLTICTANDRNKNNMVGLYVLDFPPSFPYHEALQILQPLEQLRSLQAAHVICVHNWGIDGMRAYIATDPPRGVTLRHILDNENITLPRALALIKQVTQGLLAFHTHGIIGLDLRPQLISVVIEESSEYVQLDDVGLRSILTAFGYTPTQHTDDLAFIDPRYASPEYLLHRQHSVTSDIYQVGLLLFELMAGRLPFVGRTTEETAVLQQTEAIPRLRQFVPDAPDSLQHIIDYALAKQPTHRYPNVQTLLAALNAVQWPLPASEQPAIPARESHFTQEIPIVDDAEQTILHHREQPSQPQEPLPPLPTSLGVYAYLCYKRQEGGVQRIPLLSDHVLVGRTDPKHKFRPDIDLTLFDTTATVSRKHAIIAFDGQKFTMEDQKSMNKTRHGAHILHPMEVVELHHGDLVRFGSVQMEFRIPGLAVPSTDDIQTA